MILALAVWFWLQKNQLCLLWSDFTSSAVQKGFWTETKELYILGLKRVVLCCEKLELRRIRLKQGKTGYVGWFMANAIDNGECL